METKVFSIACDGCGLSASPEHISARMERLEMVTRFRPIHVHVLFVALAPPPRLEDEFYRPPESRGFFDSFLSALNISTDAEGRGSRLETAEMRPGTESNGRDDGPALLLEFQKRGYYLTYLSECPVTTEHSASLHAATQSRDRAQLKPTEGDFDSAGLKPGPPIGSENSAGDATDLEIDSAQVSAGRECISRLAPTLIKRIRFNYRPKHVVLLGTYLSPLIGVCERVGLGPLLLLDRSAPLTIPSTGDGASVDLFRRAVNIGTSCATTL
jgi:hypothetical protein